MNAEVFQSNKIIIFGVVAVSNLAFIVAYLFTDIPLWFVLIALPVSVLIGISAMKTKLIIEDGHLHYVTWARGEEVDLMKVSQIVRREVETVGNRTTGQDGSGSQRSGLSIGSVNFGDGGDQGRKVEKIMYIIDKEGRTFFSFPASMIGYKHRTRFREGIHAVNPDIDVF